MTGAPTTLVLYVREGCHLCEQFLLDLSLDLHLPADEVALVDVDLDPDSALRFGLRVPVLEIAGEVVCEGCYDASRVRRALRV